MTPLSFFIYCFEVKMRLFDHILATCYKSIMAATYFKQVLKMQNE